MPFRSMLGYLLLGGLAAVLVAETACSSAAQDPKKAVNPSDVDKVERLLAARKEYQTALEQLRTQYIATGDMERTKWAEEELIQYHRINKQAFRLEMVVPPPTLQAGYNIKEANELYRQALTYKDKGWNTDYIDNQRRAELLLQQILTLAVDSNVRDSEITHSKYAALRTKDAICDQFVERSGRRPSVNVDEPMVGLNLHIYRNQAVLSLESSGESLHKRGYRTILSKAPLNEALAAALVLLTGWQGDRPLVDPLCGSGTLPIEACWLAINRPPGLTRRRFGFQGWLDFDVHLWTELRDEARRQIGKTIAAPIIGYDNRRDAIAFSEGCAKAAGVGHLLRFERKDLGDFKPPSDQPGVLICNPPYGERIGKEKDLRGLYQLLGKIFRERCSGWTAFVFTGNPRLARQIGLEPGAETPLFNGKIPCRLLKFDLAK